MSQKDPLTSPDLPFGVPVMTQKLGCKGGPRQVETKVTLLSRLQRPQTMALLFLSPLT